MSKSTDWSQKQRKLGRCTTCGSETELKPNGEPYGLCPPHRQAQLARMRKRYATKGY